MPFGLCNAPATFQQVMNHILEAFIGQFVAVYLDDIIIYSPNFEEHLAHIQAVLTEIENSGLKLNPEKCDLFKNSIKFLGHVVSQDGVELDEEKVIKVQEYPTPTSLKQFCGFIGFASYYRRFIPQFATIAKPLHKLLEKEVEYDWTELQEKAFQTLKTCLTTALKEYAIAYASKSLTQPERNYAATELESYVVVWAVEYFHYYLGYKPFIEYFDEGSDDEVKIILWNDTDEEIIDLGYKEEEWEIEKLIVKSKKLADETERVITWAAINGYQCEPHYWHNLEDDTQSMNIDEIYLIEIPPWGAPATGLEFIENATETKNYSIEPSLSFDRSWDMETSQDLFDEMELDAKEWTQPFDDYIDWEAYDSM
ncbi:129_t:CDS:2 [Gigaspora rosea]|nr:129_t:CDS:2 [Gigaspora rosea]